MTATISKLVDRLLEDLHCAEARDCYDKSQLKKDVEAVRLGEDELRNAFAHTRDCPYESSFQITYSCSCPFCSPR
ncbi:MAG: hypothetical protein V3S41_02125 [Spirochaetia bacterium]